MSPCSNPASINLAPSKIANHGQIQFRRCHRITMPEHCLSINSKVRNPVTSGNSHQPPKSCKVQHRINLPNPAKSAGLHQPFYINCLKFRVHYTVSQNRISRWSLTPTNHLPRHAAKTCRLAPPGLADARCPNRQKAAMPENRQCGSVPVPHSKICAPVNSPPQTRQGVSLPVIQRLVIPKRYGLVF